MENEKYNGVVVNIQKHIAFGYNVIDMTNIESVKHWGCENKGDNENHRHTFRFIYYSGTGDETNYEFEGIGDESCESIKKRAFECYSVWFNHNNMIIKKKDNPPSYET